jgi:DNA-binding MarR family transcriptional regulator
MENQAMENSVKTNSNDPLRQNVVELLRELLHAFLSASVPAWVDLQLSLPQLRTLFIIAHNKTSSVIQIAQHLGIGEPTASHLIEKLVQEDLVDRRDDPMDRRRAIIQLSGKGEKLIDRLLGWEEVLGGWMHQIPENDLVQFQRGLEAIIYEVSRKKTSTEKISEK